MSTLITGRPAGESAPLWASLPIGSNRAVLPRTLWAAPRPSPRSRLRTKRMHARLLAPGVVVVVLTFSGAPRPVLGACGVISTRVRGARAYVASQAVGAGVWREVEKG